MTSNNIKDAHYRSQDKNQYGGGRPASFYFIHFFFFFVAKMASNWGCALSSNAPYSRINTVPPRDTTSTHYKTADTDIQHCIQYITNIPHSVLTGDVNAHSTLWHSYTDDHRGQLTSKCHQQLGPHNTKHPNQSAKHHTTTNIITRHHHGV